MKFLTFFAIAAFCACPVMAQSSPAGDTASFTLNAVAPPTPAMKYAFSFDAADSISGNAAILYLDSVLLMGPNAADKADTALQAHDSGNSYRFDSLADSLKNQSLLDELTLAGRREECDWGAPFQDAGWQTLLPHLAQIRNVGRVLGAIAYRQIEQGQIDDAVKTIRLGYEMAGKLGREQTLISGLISNVVHGTMTNCVRELMNRPDAPNLYWALVQLPSREAVVRTDLKGERRWVTESLADLNKARLGQTLTAEQWRGIFAFMDDFLKDANPPSSKPVFANALRNTSPDLMARARQQYAQMHNVSTQQAGEIDPAILVGEFYFQQYLIAFDDCQKLLGLPYPVLLNKSAQYDDRLKNMTRDEPANPFLQTLVSPHRSIWKFVFEDRRTAAMTAVEAIRSYAAANNGNLPATLEDITDTPVPDNPATGMSFGYGVNGDTATLTDTQSEEPLKYTIKIRK